MLGGLAMSQLLIPVALTLLEYEYMSRNVCQKWDSESTSINGSF